MKEIDVIQTTFHHEVFQAANELRLGKVILYPTDTIWGIGCDVRNKSAVERVREIKQRDQKQSFILLVDSLRMLKSYVTRIHPRLETLLSYHRRPLTIVYKDVVNLPDHVLGPNGSVAIRICKDDFCRSIIKEFGHPVVSTSANVSGAEYPRFFGEIDPYILKEVDYTVNFKQEEVDEGQPSIIATYNHKGELEFIRE